jgi:phenylacetaldehyde dehydrogenase
MATVLSPVNPAESLSQFEYSATAKRVLARKPALFINNEWVNSTHGATVVVEDPSTGGEIARIVDASDADVDRAVTAARAAFDDGRWSNLPPGKRERIINKLADCIEAHAAEFAELEAIDNGKPVGMATVVDIPAAADHLRYMAGWASKLGGDVIEPQSMPRGTVFSYVSREPVGVAAQIVPWNFPLLMATLKISPALAAGCTLILKPAEQTSITALRLADFVVEAGFPPGVINVITGNGHTAGDRLVKHPGVDKIAFTGSTEVGKIINRNATDTLKRVTLELGGKSPVVVMPDVNIDEVAAAAAGAIFFNSGQVCIAGSRLFAHRSIFDRMVEGVAAASAFWKPRPSLDPQGHMGPLVSKEPNGTGERETEHERRARGNFRTRGGRTALRRS